MWIVLHVLRSNTSDSLSGHTDIACHTYIYIYIYIYISLLGLANTLLCHKHMFNKLFYVNDQK